jgi:hypothetical protein
MLTRVIAVVRGVQKVRALSSRTFCYVLRGIDPLGMTRLRPFFFAVNRTTRGLHGSTRGFAPLGRAV